MFFRGIGRHSRYFFANFFDALPTLLQNYYKAIQTLLLS